MFKRRFLQVLVLGTTYVVGSMPEGEISRLLTDWQSEKPLQDANGKPTEFKRDNCYRARVVQICLWREDLKGRARDIDSDADLVEIVDEWDSGLVRGLYEVIAREFLNPKATFEVFLGKSGRTGDADSRGE